MTRYLGLWGVAIFCALSVMWTVLRSANPTESKATTKSQFASFSSAPPSTTPELQLANAEAITSAPLPELIARTFLTTHIFPRGIQFYQRAAQTTSNAETHSILQQYETWKSTHIGPVEPYLALYAPYAEIYGWDEKPFAYAQLRALAQQQRESGFSDQVSDAIPPLLVVEGNTAELRALNVYGSSNGDNRVGPHRLLWRKIGEKWLITQDYAPDVYEAGLTPTMVPFPREWPSSPVESPSTPKATTLKKTVSSLQTTSTSPYRTFPNDEKQFAARVSMTSSRETPFLLQRYRIWKAAHSGPVQPLISLYAPDAKIYQEGGTLLTRDNLRSLAQSVRTTRRFDQVSDLTAPQVAISGNTAEIRACNRYGNSGNGSSSVGSRRLLWRKQYGHWFIVEDRFPDTYKPDSAY